MHIDLATTPGPLATDDADVQEDLGDIQGNILNGHGRDYASYLFLCFKDEPKARALLAGLARGSITTALDQLKQSKAFKAHGADAGLFVHTALSAEGYRFLNVSQLPEGVNLQRRRDTDGYRDVFAAGMKARATVLQDRQSEWEPAYRDGDLHAVILIAADEQAHVAQAVEKLRTLLARDALPIAEIVATEHGFVQRRRFPADPPEKIAAPVEHFGFVDNISQPALLDTQIQEEKKDWDPVAPPRLVLVKDPLGRGYGSFLVFRKLEQKVRGFWLAAQNVSQQLQSTTEVVAAMAVGRHVNGTPVVLSEKAGRAVSMTNQFNYALDPQGYRCPFQAHARKTNPRLESAQPAGNVAAQEEERGHRIARRAIPYPDVERNDFDAELTELPEGDVGLLFACYQSDIWEQFEFQQSSWCNNPVFMHPGPPQNPWDAPAKAYALGTGIDALVGQHLPETPCAAAAGPLPINWPRRWDVRPTQAGTISGFVVTRGGEYFFSPSVSGLRSLDDSAPAIELAPPP